MTGLLLIVWSLLYLSSSSTSGCILTTGGNSDGACCVFPYIYKGKLLRQCSSIDFPHSWCATTTNYDRDRKWGLCIDCVRTVTGGCCKFPTLYRGKNYNKCITADHTRPWCFMENGQWDNCQETTCTNGWHYYNHSCYRSYSDQYSWEIAREVCKADGADLLKISSEKENNFVKKDLALPLAPLTGMWLGLYRSPERNRQFVWVDGQPVTYNNWSPEEPNDFKQEEGCAEIVIPAAYKGQWNDINCKAKMPFACEEVIGDPCKFRNGDCAHYCRSYDRGVNCTCRTGFTLGYDSRSCDDIDECATTNGGCSHKCVNTAGEYYCQCEHEGLGLNKDGKSCIDIDECKSDNGKCSHVCINTWGSYHCACTEPEYNLGRDNRTCAIPPRIMHPLVDQTIVEGSHLVLTCISFSSPAPTFSWTKDGNSSIPRSEQYGNNAILSITNIQSVDQGLYECTAINVGGEARTASQVNVTVPPRLFNVSQAMNVIEGNNVTMSCLATGVPKPEVVWGYYLDIFGAKTVHVGEVYTIENVTSKHRGEYMCRAHNGIGADSVANIFLDVKYAPKIDMLRSESRLISTAGQKVIISCHADGNPPPVYSWRKNGQPLNTLDKKNIQLAGKDIIVLPEHQHDFGVYTCTAKNPIGSAEHSVSLLEVQTAALTSAFIKNEEGNTSVGMTASLIILVITVITLVLVIACMSYQKRKYSTNSQFVSFSKGASNPLHVESEDLTHLQSNNSFNVQLDDE